MLKVKKLPRSKSVITKVTVWYSLLVLLLLTLVVGGAFLISGAWSEAQVQADLRDKVSELSYDLEDFESVDDGIYFSLYDENGQLIQGGTPKGFDESLTLKNGVLSDVTLGQTNYQYLDSKLSDRGYWLRAVRLKSAISREVQLFLWSLLFISPVFLAIMTFGGYRILKKSFGPVDSMTQTAFDIAEHHDYSRRISVPETNDEISRLAMTFNSMLSSIADSFAREKQFTNNASHELRTPIAVIMAESEFGRNYASDLVEAKESHEIIYRQASQMKAMVEQILDLTRTEQTENIHFEEVSLSRLVADYLQDKQRLMTEKNLKLVSQISSDLAIRGDKILLTRLLDNLFSNALKFTKDEIVVSLREQNNQIMLSVSDNGIGIADEEQSKIWDKFYQVDDARTKSERQGAGLGLSLVASIARLHGATYSLDSALNQGTTIRIHFPK